MNCVGIRFSSATQLRTEQWSWHRRCVAARKARAWDLFLLCNNLKFNSIASHQTNGTTEDEQFMFRSVGPSWTTTADNLPTWNIDWFINCKIVFACVQFSKCFCAMKLDKLSNHCCFFSFIFAFQLLMKLHFMCSSCIGYALWAMQKEIKKASKQRIQEDVSEKNAQQWERTVPFQPSSNLIYNTQTIWL